MLRTTLFLIVHLAVLPSGLAPRCLAAGEADFYVAPGGKDNHPGTKTKPLKSIDKARPRRKTTRPPMPVRKTRTRNNRFDNRFGEIPFIDGLLVLCQPIFFAWGAMATLAVAMLAFN